VGLLGAKCGRNLRLTVTVEIRVPDSVRQPLVGGKLGGAGSTRESACGTREAPAARGNGSGAQARSSGRPQSLLLESPTASAGKSSATKANRVLSGEELSNPTMCWWRLEPALN